MKNKTKLLIVLPILIIIYLCINILIDNNFLIDDIIYNLLTKNININLTNIYRFISFIGSTPIIILIALITLLIFKNKKINISIIINLLSITFINNILKLIFMRERPNINPLVEEKFYSFPSGHAMISMAFFGYLIYLIYKQVKNKKVKNILIIALSILILLIGISRIYLGVHYFTDIIGGYCFAIIHLLIMINIINKKVLKV